MARPRPSLSISLPPTLNLEFSDRDGHPPKTPDQHEEPKSANEPPPPPRQKYTVKRRRAEIVPLDEPLLLPDLDTVIPTIEMSEAASELSSPILAPSSSGGGLLAPLPAFQRFTTPKTPCAKTSSFNEPHSPAHEWDLINDMSGNKRPAFQRSNSVCSSFSDSSISSAGSSAFSAPNGGCTSPDSVATDPFMEEDMARVDKFILSPSEKASSPSAKRVKRHRHVKWTTEMDQHLENTYIRYLSDPRVTPFKTLPGVPPPLGVCNRVAARARHTWKQHRSATPSPLDTILESDTFQKKREGSPDTIRPETDASKDLKQQPQWPRSDAATRKRLRKLVKCKPALSAHYQRLLRTRSPSPFTTSSSVNRSSEPPPSAFSGQDMKMSLITSTAPSMQPEGPLAQLTSDGIKSDEPPQRPQSQRSSRPADWFTRIGRSQAHQKSLSLQSGLSLETDNTQQPAFLASPFDEAFSRSHLLHSMSTTKSLGRTGFNEKDVKAPSLDSPFEVKGAPTLPRTKKRRFKSDEEKPRRPGLEAVFGPLNEDTSVARNRGFSVGTARASNNLSQIFEPPPTIATPTMATPVSADHEMTEAPPASDTSSLGPMGSRSAPRRLVEPVPRLGSPFMETPATSRLFNTFPRSYIPTASNPQPFQQRLRELAADPEQNEHA